MIMIDQDRDPKPKWRLALAVVVLALLACGFSIYLATQKVAVEKKVEDTFWPDPNMPKPSPVFVPFGPQENEN